MFARACAVLLAVGLVGVAGCGPGRLDETKTFNLNYKDVNEMSFDLPAQSAEQTVILEVNSNEEVDVFVVAAKDRKEFENSVGFKGHSAKALGAKEKVKSETFSVNIPPKTDATVVVSLSANSENANVTLKMSNKK